MEANSEAYSEPFHSCKMEIFAKIVNSILVFDCICIKICLTLVKILSLPLKPVRKLHLHVWQGLELAFVKIEYFRKNIDCLFSKFDLINKFHHISSNAVLLMVKPKWPYVQHICLITKIKKLEHYIYKIINCRASKYSF